MDPIVAAVHRMLSTNIADLRDLVRGMGTADLNRAPAPATSSIAVLVAHSVSSTRFLVDQALAGRADRTPYARQERPAAFATEGATADDLLRLLGEFESVLARLAAVEGGLDWGAEVIFEDAFDRDPRTRAWSLIHAVEHLREHVGHAQLTRQMLEVM